VDCLIPANELYKLTEHETSAFGSSILILGGKLNYELGDTYFFNFSR